MSDRSRRWTRRLGRWSLVAGVPVGLMLSAVWVWQDSQAAYTATTTNAGNGFSAGTVTLHDDDSGVAMFSVAGLQPGDVGEKCIAVTYGGSLDAAVRLFVAPGDVTGTGLDGYLQLKVEQGTGGSSASCTGFTPTSTIVNGTLAAFAAASTDAATGVGTFDPTSAGQSAVYRFSYSVADDNAAQGLTCQVAFTWEASSV